RQTAGGILPHQLDWAGGRGVVGHVYCLTTRDRWTRKWVKLINWACAKSTFFTTLSPVFVGNLCRLGPKIMGLRPVAVVCQASVCDCEAPSTPCPRDDSHGYHQNLATRRSSPLPDAFRRISEEQEKGNCLCGSKWNFDHLS